MATYYYDKNGTTPGFATLTGNWSDVAWSTSGAGTSATAAVTFTTADTATFGGTSNTAVGGTITAAGTINLGAITVQNLSTTTTQTISGGTLAFGSVNGVITAGATGSGDVSIGSTVTGTNGLTKNGGGLVFFTGNTATTSGLSGTITMNGGLFIVQPTTTPVTAFGSAGSIVINSGLVIPRPNVASGAITFSSNFSGAGGIQHNSDLGFATSTTITGSVSGLASVKANAGGSAATITLKDLPASGSATCLTGAGATPTINANYTVVASIATDIQFEGVGGAFVFNSNGSAAFTTSGALKRLDSSATAISVTLGGAGGMTIYGAGTNAGSGLVNLTKTDGGTVTLGASNSAFGNNTVTLSGGTIQAGNSTALGGAGGGSLTMSAGTAFELTGGINVAKALSTSGTVRNVSGSNTLSGTLALTAATVFESQAGALTLSGANNLTGNFLTTLQGAGDFAIDKVIATGTAGVTKAGAGTATLSAANTFTGALTLNGGTVSVSTLAASGTSSGIGAGSTVAFGTSGVLRYTGAVPGLLTRSISFTSATGSGFENNGTSTMAVSGTPTLSGASNIIVLKGIQTGFNTLSSALGTSATTGFNKSGAGRWIVSGGGDLGGATSVTGGNLTGAAGAAAYVAGKKLLGGNVTVGAASKIQLASDNGQAGRNTYGDLTFSGGTLGNESRIRIGGSAINPTVSISGSLTLPTSGTITWDLSADVFKSPGTYVLFEVSGSVNNWPVTPSSVILTTGLASGRSATFNLNAGTPNTITVTIS